MSRATAIQNKTRFNQRALTRLAAVDVEDVVRLLVS
jgi:hypothetical protein